MDLLKPFLGLTIISVFALGASQLHANKNHGESNADGTTRQFIKKEAQAALEDHSEATATLISDSIMAESKSRHLDPLLILAVTYHESRFNVLATGDHGEIGLMQIRPQTAQWISRKFHLQWNGASTLINPSVNIRIGAAYLAYLRDRFHGREEYFLSAYNLGPKKMNSQLREDIHPSDYRTKVDQVYEGFSSKLFCLVKPRITAQLNQIAN